MPLSISYLNFIILSTLKEKDFTYVNKKILLIKITCQKKKSRIKILYFILNDSIFTIFSINDN